MKEWKKPFAKVVFIEDADIVTESDPVVLQKGYKSQDIKEDTDSDDIIWNTK